MTAAWPIAKREIRSTFNSPVAYIVATVYTLLAGYMFWSNVLIEKQAEMRSYFGLAPLIFTFIIPAITMRLLAEEKASGTLETLITMPVREWEVVLGKFVAALAFVGAIIGLTLSYVLTLGSLAEIDKGPAYGGYFGLFLMGAAYAAIGVMASSFTRNQIVAFIIAFAISFALYLFGKITQLAPEALQPLLAFLAFDAHFEAISRGVIDSRDILYYLSVIVVSLVIATVSLDARRWR